VKQIKQFVKHVIIFYTVIALIYWPFIRPTYFSWGATKEEKNMKLPGDSLISPNRIVSTRSINIQASKKDIWPWIAQTGQNRGGFNSYYWLENLFGAKMTNATGINLQWQNPKPGDTVYYGKDQGYELISLVEPPEYYCLAGWTFYLYAVDSNNTRLTIRYPSMEVRQSKFAKIYYYGLFESLHFIMESGMMMGIKQRAEKYKRP
jgi:hypothetical protein